MRREKNKWRGSGAIRGNLLSLRDQFTSISDIPDVFACCVDTTSPIFANGFAVLLSADDGYYKQASPLFDASLLRSLAVVLADAHDALSDVCNISTRPTSLRYILGSHRTENAPETIPLAINPDTYPDFLAADANFAVLAASHYGDAANPQFVLMMTDVENGQRRRVLSASVQWLDRTAEAVAEVALLVPNPSASSLL